MDVDEQMKVKTPYNCSTLDIIHLSSNRQTAVVQFPVHNHKVILGYFNGAQS